MDLLDLCGGRTEHTHPTHPPIESADGGLRLRFTTVSGYALALRNKSCCREMAKCQRSEVSVILQCEFSAYISQ